MRLAEARIEEDLGGRWFFSLVDADIMVYEGAHYLSREDALDERRKMLARWQKEYESGVRSAVSRAAKFCRYVTKP